MSTITMPLGFYTYIQPIQFDETDSKDLEEKVPKSRIKILEEGEWEHPKYGDVTVTVQDLKDYKKHFDEKVRGIELAVDQSHGETADKDKAAGWFKEIEFKHPKDGKACLFAIVEWTPIGKELIENQIYKYFSPEFVPEWTNNMDGKVYKHVLLGGALVNRPFLKDLGEVTLNMSEVLQDKNTKEDDSTQETEEEPTVQLSEDFIEVLSAFADEEPAVNQALMQLSEAESIEEGVEALSSLPSTVLESIHVAYQLNGEDEESMAFLEVAMEAAGVEPIYLSEKDLEELAMSLNEEEPEDTEQVKTRFSEKKIPFKSTQDTEFKQEVVNFSENVAGAVSSQSGELSNANRRIQELELRLSEMGKAVNASMRFAEEQTQAVKFAETKEKLQKITNHGKALSPADTVFFTELLTSLPEKQAKALEEKLAKGINFVDMREIGSSHMTMDDGDVDATILAEADDEYIKAQKEGRSISFGEVLIQVRKKYDKKS